MKPKLLRLVQTLTKKKKKLLMRSLRKMKFSKSDHFCILNNHANQKSTPNQNISDD